ncbi:MAG: hypothetical protein ACKO2P_06875 [Planctomycetota bacterium]
MKSFPRFSAIALSSLALSAVAGCGSYGGGAGVVPQVSFIAAGGAAEESSAATGDTSAELPTGSLKGRVVLSGGSPSLPLLIAKGSAVKDAEVCAAEDVPDERLVVGADGAVANVFVYLPKAPKGAKSAEVPADPFLFDQKTCRFLPHATIIPVRQTVKVLSNDSVAHNTHTFPQKNAGINSTVNPMDRDGLVSFAYTKAEAVPLAVKCDFHAWMNAWHLPLDHSFGAVSNGSGEFEIPNLPAGKHAFVVWHEAANGGFVQRKLEVEIKAGETAEVSIDYPASLLKL